MLQAKTAWLLLHRHVHTGRYLQHLVDFNISEIQKAANNFELVHSYNDHPQFGGVHSRVFFCYSKQFCMQVDPSKRR